VRGEPAYRTSQDLGYRLFECQTIKKVEPHFERLNRYRKLRWGEALLRGHCSCDGGCNVGLDN
jgi:hypothetical protein